MIDEYVADMAVPSLHHRILVHLHTWHELDLLELLRDHPIAIVVQWLHQSTLQQLVIFITPELCSLVVDLKNFAS